MIKKPTFENNGKTKNTDMSLIIKWIFSILIVIIVIFVVDIFNLPSSFCNSIVKNINLDLWAIIIPSVITITLFITTYVLVNRYQKKKEENKANIAKYMILLLYQDCDEVIELLDNKMVKDKISKTVDFDKIVIHSELFSNLTRSHEKYYESLNPYIYDGVLKSDIVKDVMRIHFNFVSYVNLAITFFDMPEVYYDVRKGLLKDIETSRSKLGITSVNRGDYLVLKKIDEH